MTQGLVPFPQLFQTATAEQFDKQMLQVADVLGLRTTSWEQGDPSRTVFSVEANMFMLTDVDIALLAQGGFLDYAANGSVTYIDPVNGETVTVLVTPDPSDPAQNPTGALGMLDVLANSVYDVDRTLSTKAGGALALVNTSAGAYGPFDPETYHVAQPGAVGSPTYANTTTLNIPPSAVVGVVTGTSSAGGLIELTVVGHGLTTDDPVFVLNVGGTVEANGAWYVTVTGADTFTLQGSAFTNAWTSGGTVYTPTVATFTADVSGTSSTAASPNLVTQPVTTFIGVSVANLTAWVGSDTENNASLVAKCRLKLQSLSPNGPKGAYEFFALQAFFLAPLLNPPLTMGTPVTKALVVSDYFTGTVTTTLATANGVPTDQDVIVVDTVLQAYCVPDAITAITQKAAAVDVAVVINIWLPAAYKDTIVPIAQNAVKAYFELLPIGGVTDPGESPPQTNVVPYNAVLGAVWQAAKVNKIPVQQITGTLDDGGGAVAANVQLALTPTPEVARLVPEPVIINVIPL